MTQSDAERHEAHMTGQGWARIHPSRYTALVGPIWTTTIDGRPRYSFRVNDKHDNTEHRAHGGMVMSFCDEALGLAARLSRPADRLLTISFECQFVSGAGMGDFVEIEPEIVNSSRSLVFMRGTCKAGERVVATCSGIWKRVGATQNFNEQTGRAR